jgi:uncharacterized protein (DUF2141 family)
MKTATLLAGAMLLAVTSLGARQLLDLHISPSVSTAPATFKVRATVPPDADNRAITFSADSESFFRSSEVQLDGDKAPRTILMEFRDLPAGTYEVSAVLNGAGGKQLAGAHSTVVVTGFGSN